VPVPPPDASGALLAIAKPAGIPPGMAIAKPAEIPTGRTPILNQEVVVVCEVLSATGVPSVNTLGGADPYVEVRIVTGEDPAGIHGGDTTRKPVASAKTKVLKNCMTPEWKETFVLQGASCKQEFYVQLIMFDQNSGRKNTALGHASLSLAAAILGCSYNGKDERSKAVHELPLAPCDVLAAIDVSQTRLKVNFWYYEMHKWKLTIKKGTKLPQMKTMGAIDSFVEARLCKKDPKTKPVQETPSKDVIWHKQTETVVDSLDPEWNQNLTFVAAGDPKMFLQLILYSGATTFSAAQPLGCAILPMDKVLAGKLGGGQETQVLKFAALHGVEPPEGLSDARLTIKLGFELSQDGD